MSKAFDDARLDSAIAATVDTYIEFGLRDEQIEKRLMEKYDVSHDVAVRYVKEANLIIA